MSVYIIGTSLSMLFAYIATHISYTNQLRSMEIKMLKKLFIFLSFLPLTAIMAFRYDVGTDFKSYESIFLHGAIKRMEKGYVALNEFLKMFTHNPQIVFIISAIIICTGYFFLFYKESINPAYSILLFVISKDYFMSLNGMRQYIATAIILFAVPSMRKKKWKSVLIALLIAFLFHRTSIIFLLLYILYHFEIPPVIAVSTAIATLFASSTLLHFMERILRYWGYYNAYFVNESDYYNNMRGINYTFALVYISFFILLSYKYSAVKTSDSLKLMYSAVTVELLLIGLSPAMPTNFHWVMFHLNSIIAAYTPQLIKSVQNRFIKYAANTVIIVAYSAMTIVAITNGNQDVLPYQSIWSR